jgi:hypothetical protein
MPFLVSHASRGFQTQIDRSGYRHFHRQTCSGLDSDEPILSTINGPSPEKTRYYFLSLSALIPTQSTYCLEIDIHCQDFFGFYLPTPKFLITTKISRLPAKPMDGILPDAFVQLPHWHRTQILKSYSNGVSFDTRTLFESS